jgi:hypothetical protein
MKVSKKEKTSKPEIKIVFETSSIYTKSEHYFFNKEISDLITSNNNHTDITISWFIPEIVKHERYYQMSKKAFELLPSVERLEKLLGHNLNITKDIVVTRVNEAIEKQLHDFKVNVIKLDIMKVDWSSIILNSVLRKPPFETGDTEKGFRDALIAESFLQLVEQSPVTAKLCRLVLMNGDKLLTQAVTERIKGKTNINILPTVEELKGFINTLVSKADESFIDAIKEKSGIIFFQKENKETLYYKLGLRKRISEEFKEQLNELPEQCDTRENGTWYIGKPQFAKKERQRIFWTTTIRVEAKAYSNIRMQQKEEGQQGLTAAYIGRQLSPLAAYTTEQGLTAAFTGRELSPLAEYTEQGSGLVLNHLAALYNKQEKVLKAHGSTVFQIDWSISVTTRTKRLSKPKTENIVFVETIWETS